MHSALTQLDADGRMDESGPVASFAARQASVKKTYDNALEQRFADGADTEPEPGTTPETAHAIGQDVLDGWRRISGGIDVVTTYLWYCRIDDGLVKGAVQTQRMPKGCTPVKWFQDRR